MRLEMCFSFACANTQGFKNVGGVDEAGTGALAGNSKSVAHVSLHAQLFLGAPFSKVYLNCAPELSKVHFWAKYLPFHTCAMLHKCTISILHQ